LLAFLAGGWRFLGVAGEGTLTLTVELTRVGSTACITAADNGLNGDSTVGS